MHKLTIEDDEGKTVVVPLIREEITVGRQEGNSIRLTERNISRRHARFYRQNGTLFVEDLGSYNGIKVNGTRISEATGLKDADLVVVGDYKLTVRSDRPVQTRLYAGGAPFSPATGGPTTVPAGTLVGTPNLSAVPGGAAGAATAGSATAAVTPLRPGTLPSAPAPDASLDAAPTIPVRTLAEQGLAAGDSTAPARLVVVSTNLAGSDFLLDRASLVIGRTPENDIVLNHKSISRHHAKISRDGEKYIVVDLESANGVRVNGSEFERVELQTGDTLELGHVRLKFAAGNEFVDFDAAAAGGGKRKLIIAGAVGAVALAGIVLTLAAGDGASERGTVAQRPAETTPATSNPPSNPEPAVAIPAAPNPALEPLLTDARAAIQREDWNRALDHVKRALEIAPTSTDAATLRETIDSEQSASERWTRLKAASDQRKHEEVLALFPTIPEKSVYRGRALPLKQTAERKLIDQSLSEAEKAQGRGQCEEARKALDRVTAIDPDNVRARSVTEKCEKENTRPAEKQAKQAEQQAQLEAQQQAKLDKADKQRLEREALVAARAAAPPSTPRERPTSTVTEIKTPPTPRAAPPERPVAAVVRPDPEPPAPRPARPAPRPAATPPAAEPMPTGDPEAMLNEATQSWLRGQYAAAIETSRKALKIRPNTARAYQIIAVCSCSLRDADGATKAYERLEERMKPLVKSACQKNGISLQ